jgi:predicted O-methyltransferase YrrM
MAARDDDQDALRARVDALEGELAQRRAEAAEGWGRYHELHRRRAVRAALKLAGLRQAVRSTRRRAAPGADAPEPRAAPAQPEATAAPVAPEPPAVAHVWELGHFYSPVPDTRELATPAGRARVWPPVPRETPGVEWREREQLALLRELAELPPLPFPDAPTGDATEYHTANPQFSELDAWTLQAILRHVRPSRVIEVGCGWSSLVTARVNRECLGGDAHVVCIEPYPPEFLTEAGVPGITELMPLPVQEVPVERFEALGAGDVLFIDTSHVIKTGNDVQYLYHEVVPRLREGVVVHIHDIFLPWDYPQDWVLGGRAWNEQYLVQSFLAFNRAFEVLLGVGWLTHFHRDALVAAATGGERPLRGGGGSLWLRRSA